jgi:ABC-type branched-subunit amino acid transport system substrate-binding protein
VPRRPLSAALLGVGARFVAAVCAAAVLAAGCTSSGDGNGGAGTTQTEAPGPPLRSAGFDQSRITVGVVADLSGPDAARGGRLLGGAEAFWADVASRGGVDGRYPVQVVIIDSGGDPAEALRQVDQRAGDVVLISMAASAALAEAIRPVLVDDGLSAVVVNPAAGTYAEPTGMGAGLPTASRVEALSGWLLESGQTGRWCTLEGTDAAVIEAAAAAAGAAGVELAGPLAPPAGSSPAGAASGAGCAVVWLGGGPGDSTALVDLARAGFGGRVAMMADDLAVPDEAAAWAPERLLVATAAPSWDSSESGVAEMAAGVAAETPGLAPSDDVALGWASQQVVERLLSDAVAAGSLDREEIARQAAELSDPPSLAGSWSGPAGSRTPSGRVTIWSPGGPGGEPRSIVTVVPVGAATAPTPSTPPSTG